MRWTSWGGRETSIADVREGRWKGGERVEERVYRDKREVSMFNNVLEAIETYAESVLALVKSDSL
jgi:hypothetical protein